MSACAGYWPPVVHGPLSLNCMADYKPGQVFTTQAPPWVRCLSAQGDVDFHVNLIRTRHLQQGHTGQGTVRPAAFALILAATVLVLIQKLDDGILHPSQTVLFHELT